MKPACTCKRLISLFLAGIFCAVIACPAFSQDFESFTYYSDYLSSLNEQKEQEEAVEIPEPAEVAEPEPVEVTAPVEVPAPVEVAEPVEVTEPVEVPEPLEAPEPVEAAEPEEVTEPVAESEPLEEPAEPEMQKYEALAMIRYKNLDAITFKLKVSYIPEPYILGISFAAGYTAYKVIQPFYFGGFIEPHVGIPQKKFPYKYELDGTTLSGPLIVGGKLYIPFGLCVFPFQKNIEFFAEFAPGISFNMMWNTKFADKAITSKLYPAFYSALRTGVTYKGFTFYIEGNYDAILGFGVSAGVGYSLNVHITAQEKEMPSLE